MSRRARMDGVIAAICIGLIAFFGAQDSRVFASSGTAIATPALAVDPDSGVIAHEWGTFTSIAGDDGNPISWQPLGAHTDLPCFVRILNPKSAKNWVPRIAATVRMETPVIYFYSAAPRSVRVSVKLPRALVTEWYPDAKVPPFVMPADMNVANASGEITWNGVRIEPGSDRSFPAEDEPSRYYAARATDAAPLRVGGQREKFLFYRGLADFPIPVAATVSTHGQIVVRTTGSDPVKALILFEKRGDRIGYRVVRNPGDTVALDAPTLDGMFDALRADLERLLIAEGLYPREAAAMVDTWRDSWMESGTRLFYLVPRARIDSILPLQITPAPTTTVRVFVGRLEIVTPTMIDDVVAMVRTHDYASIDGYGRVASEIMERAGGRISPAERAATESAVEARQPNGEQCSSPVRRWFNSPVRRY
jgi:hypothetical protein